MTMHPTYWYRALALLDHPTAPGFAHLPSFEQSLIRRLDSLAEEAAYYQRRLKGWAGGAVWTNALHEELWDDALTGHVELWPN